MVAQIKTLQIKILFVLVMVAVITGFAFTALAHAANTSPTTTSKNSQPIKEVSQSKSDTLAGQEQQQLPSKRGRGLTNAIEHVPTFVAEKLAYQAQLFADGVKGIGQSLSEWIYSFFSPVVNKRAETDSVN